MKVTLITTVLNEEGSILQFLESISGQTRKPDEVVIVDGGSADNTVERIQNSKFKIQNFKSKVKIIEKKGNRSVGRNTAINNSSNSIIAVTDAGCILDKHWLERLIKPFEDQNVDVVAGYYKPLNHSIFQKCLATYTCTMPDKLDLVNFLPSSRSVAFKKEAWEKVKGYPEELETCEDLVFDKKLKASGFKFVTQKSAFVWWPQRKNLWEAALQFYLYAKGDGQARYFRHSTPLLFGRYLAGLGFLGYIILSNNLAFQGASSAYHLISIIYLLIFGYLVWSIAKNYRHVRDVRAFVYLPLLQLTSDMAVLIGTSRGYLKTLR